MPKPKKTEESKETGGKEVLKDAAKAIGSALGAVAKKTGIAHTGEPSKKTPKLVKKGKQRLPRKAKKKAQKTTDAATHSSRE